MTTTYDPRNLTWDYYCSLMSEQFAPNDLGTVPEDRWREWADAINGIGYFVQSATPDQRLFATWQEWAMQLVGIMSVEPQ